MNLDSGAVALITPRGHTQLGRGFFIYPAAGTKTGLVDRVSHRHAVTQGMLELIDAAGFGVFQRRDTHITFEGPLQIRQAEVELPAQGLQRQRLVGMLVDVVADRPHQLKLGVVAGVGIGVAAFARAKASLPRQFGQFEEDDVLPFGCPRRARRAAVDARRAHSQEKLTVKSGVFVETRFPKYLFGDCMFHHTDDIIISKKGNLSESCRGYWQDYRPTCCWKVKGLN